MNLRPFLLATALALTTTQASASWLYNLQVNQIANYTDYPGSFVWFDQPHPVCAAANPGNPVVYFDKSTPGGNATYSMLMTALMSGKKVHINVSGCYITEVILNH